MEDPALARATFLVQLSTACNVWIGGLGSAMAIPALAYNWPAMDTGRLARVGLVTTALAMLCAGGLQSASALRHRPAGAARGLCFAGVAALAIALPAMVTFFWELIRSVRLAELEIWSSRVFGPALVMVVGGALAALNLVVVGIYGRALDRLEPEASATSTPE